MQISLTDWVLLGVLLASMLVGLWRGLVYEVLSLAGWVGAFILAQWLAADAVVYLPFLAEAAAQVQYAVAFGLVFVVALFAAGILSWLVKKLVETIGLRPIDRALGGIFGVARGVVLLLALTVVLQLLGMTTEVWWQNAAGPVWLDTTLKGLKPLLPQTLVDLLP